MKRLTIFSLMILAAPPLWAASNSLTLNIPGMTCSTCPITIKRALMKERGVSGVVVHYEKKELVVSFDDAKITASKIMQTTASVGFPSQIVK